MKSNLISTIGIIIFFFIGSALAAPPQLTLVKEVVGGEATVTDWVLTADGTDANDLSGAGFISGFVNPDTFLLSESAGQPGYTAGDWDCTGGGILDGQSLTLSTDEVVTCTIINTYEPPVVVFDTDFALPAMPIGDGLGTPVCIDVVSGLLIAGCDAAFNTNLTEAEVDAFVSNNGYSTGSHTVDTDTHLSEGEVDSFVANNGYSTGSHTVDTTCSLSACIYPENTTTLTCGATSIVVNCALGGANWTSRSADENYWRSVTYGGGLFVAVGGSGTNRVMTSPDGITWTPRSATENNTWSSVTYGNGLFVAVANNSFLSSDQVMISPDGVTWTPRSAAEANIWESVTYGDGLFVAVSINGTNRVMTSPDGITWTPRVAAEANQWVSVTYGGGLFVAVAPIGTNRVMTSPDGVTWTPRSATEDSDWVSVTYGGGLFVAVTNDGTNRLMTSPDGVTWTTRSAAEANQWWAVTYGDGLFVAVSYDGTNQVMTSPDGITWTPRRAAEANAWRSVTYGDGLFVAVSINGTNRVMTSP
jgi:hypothetical protein